MIKHFQNSFQNKSFGRKHFFSCNNHQHHDEYSYAATEKKQACVLNKTKCWYFSFNKNLNWFLHEIQWLLITSLIIYTSLCTLKRNVEFATCTYRSVQYKHRIYYISFLESIKHLPNHLVHWCTGILHDDLQLSPRIMYAIILQYIYFDIKIENTD